MQRITSVQHPLVKHLAKLRKNRRYRYEKKRVLIEGKKMVRELPFPCQTVLVTEESLACPSEEAFLVTPEIIEKISGAKTPEGVVAEADMPKPRSFAGFTHVIALDGVSDPGNLGTLIRTALALRWQGVFILDNCCDPYNDKALRASKGATFHLPLNFGTWEALQALLVERRLHPFVADLNGTPLDALTTIDNPLLILGSEAHGPSVEAKKSAKAVTIPLFGQVDSLNVAQAGAILMYAMRQR